MLKDTLKELRENRSLTKKQAAAGIGITDRAYIAYEYGERDVSTETLSKIADFYNVTTDYLLGREAAPDPFGDLNLCEEDEAEVLKKYMSLPDSIRACMLDVLVQLGDAAKSRESENPKPKNDNANPSGTSCHLPFQGRQTVSTTLGELEDQQQAEAAAQEKDVG